MLTQDIRISSASIYFKNHHVCWLSKHLSQNEEYSYLLFELVVMKQAEKQNVLGA